MRRSMVSILVLSASFLICLPLSHAQERPSPGSSPEKLTLDSLCKLYGPVEFNHAMHASMADSCTQCHHADSEEAGSGTPCRDCHSTFDPAMAEMPGLKGAYHQNCFECHEIKAGSDPTGCSGKCHTKKVE